MQKVGDIKTIEYVAKICKNDKSCCIKLQRIGLLDDKIAKWVVSMLACLLQKE
jgi:hypothetical protein